MEEIKEIILSHCKGIAYPEFELEDLNVMVKEINDHYTKVQSQELTKAKEIERLKKQLADNIADSNHQRHNFVMSEIKVKSQAKELEGLKRYTEHKFNCATNRFDSRFSCNCGLDELLKDTTQSDKGGE